MDLLDKNYCLVSNLPFIGMLIERVVVDQLSAHIQANELMEPLQSAYRPNHSTKTALVTVKAAIHEALDNKEVVCLVLLDLSAAFDTVDHKILLDTLEKRFGITDTALKWVESYLHQHTQRVVVQDLNMDGSMSNSVTLIFGVLPGSVLGPTLFTLYTMPLGDIWRKYSITYHLYTGDWQRYLSFKPAKTGTKEDCLDQLERCIGKIRSWIGVNMLKLNDDKMEFIVFGTCQQIFKMNAISVHVGDNLVSPVNWVCNLGYFMDKWLKNTIHINSS